MRQLAYKIVVSETIPIPGADKVHIARIKNWNVVVNKEIKAGDAVVYFEPDTLIPDIHTYFSFLDKQENYYLVSSRTIRGVKSQGLCIPLSDALELLD